MSSYLADTPARGRPDGVSGSELVGYAACPVGKWDGWGNLTEGDGV